ncbi:MAG: hypothetical protein A2X13_11610 [Bacteroidetes bacterium GWC2_33_15]|nr:MAG: hypothetical protein A2X10_05635 [Bacteroidetes bacterium GWA2_33_15]OFX50784.1 MAG: hypothetical protein A2X13_11610 [Bacteroidetes bacterium GWC2_33_15]OFX62933.1 MAG: hypothetical protein A2X15_09760 [Bacteroidetes bacterium GWB2_32_14]OFX70003.1 MAG: hypothetical protein A2X14_02620 [Bacteroidetes bacterium GWD2_33_33]HAN18999.1 hypothetical protein [Bacteroidales bacterium]
MELKLLIKNTSYLVFSRIIKFLVGVLRAKLIAIFLGVVGAGIISQLTMITNRMSQFTLLGMNDGLVKQIAESRSEILFKNKLAVLLKSYIVVAFIIFIPSFSLLLIFSKNITIYIFGDLEYYNYFLFGLFSYPILVLNSISFALLKGFKLVKYIARSEIIIIGVNFIIFIPLVYYFGILGGVIHIAFSFLSILIVNNYFARTKIFKDINLKISDLKESKVSFNSVKELLQFAGIGITSGFAIIISEVITRAIVVKNLGVEGIGIYSPVESWAALFTGFILPSIFIYLYPRFSESKSNVVIVGLINDTFRLVSFIMLPILMIAIPLRYQIIPIFYSINFTSAGDFLPGHFIGVLFYIWMMSLSQVFTPTGRIKIYGLFLIIISSIDILIVYFLVPHFGLYGWMFKFIVSPLIFFIVYFQYLKPRIKLRIERDNFLLMCFVAFAAILLYGQEFIFNLAYYYNLLIGLLLLSFSFLFIKPSEKEFTIQYLSNLIKKIKN